MNTKQSVFIATSLDGYIARLNGDIDWLTAFESSDDTAYGFHEFMDSVDGLVMGRHTFEKVIDLEKWPYPSKKVVVLSSHPLKVPDKLLSKVDIMSGSPAEIIDTLSGKGYYHLYVDGGKTIQRFLRKGFIQEMIITVVPVLIGEGIPLFGSLERDIKLERCSTTPFENGLVQNRYRVLHND